MDGTILGQGTFTAVGGATTIAIPSNADFMWVKNFTQSGLQTANTGVNFYWQRGMAAGTGIVQFVNSSSALLSDTLKTGGFTLFDPSVTTSQFSAGVALTAVTNAVQPVISTTVTTGVVAASSTNPGSIVRVNSKSFPDNGIDFTVSAVSAGASITLLSTAAQLATAPGAAGTTGTYQILNFNALFYPRRRYVTNISVVGGLTTVATSVPHGLTPGQAVRFNIPSVSGMTQLNPTTANNYLSPTVTTISATDANIFTIDTDITSFTTFTWPTSTQAPSSFPAVTPVGENTANALVNAGIQVPGVSSATLGSQIFNTNTGILADSTVNTGFLGMILGTGGAGVTNAGPIAGPAGVTSDVIYWVAGKSTYGGL